MAGLSYINTGVKQTPDLNFNIPTDESVGGMLFDISGFSNPFASYPLLYNNFKNGTVQCINNMDDAELLGITNDGFLNGVLYYHISQFYKYVEGTQALYICIADCTQDWDIIQSMQQQVSGRMFQIGVWTTQPVWNTKSDGKIGFTQLITDLQLQANEICGKVGMSTHTTTPLNIVLCGGTLDGVDGNSKLNFKKLPDAMVLNCPKVSVVLAQNGIESVHQMQVKNPRQAPVGALGFVMACLALCGAEESIGSLQKCDLNKGEQFNYPELGFGKDYTTFDMVNRVWANVLSTYGYIIPVDYEGLEASYFFSSDQTLSDGDYRSIANNRVMHKCRRAACTTLIPYVNSHHIYTPGTKNISITSIAIITDSINTILDSVMRNKKGQEQIGGRVVTFKENDKIMENDSIFIDLKINPINYSGFISEEVSHDTE